MNKLPKISFLGNVFEEHADHIVNSGKKIGIDILVVEENIINRETMGSKHFAKKYHAAYAILTPTTNRENLNDFKVKFLSINT